MKRLGLVYVALVVRDIEGVARTLSGAFGLTQAICLRSAIKVETIPS